MSINLIIFRKKKERKKSFSAGLDIQKAKEACRQTTISPRTSAVIATDTGSTVVPGGKRAARDNSATCHIDEGMGYD